MPMHLELGDRLRLRKPHPCGGSTWQVVRLGADIGLRCETCGRRVLLPRSEVERRTKERLPPVTPPAPDDDPQAPSTFQP
ncbi:MAG: DUF951 domain-containing protein [Thermogemmatispora sp.]|nr:DUF951 domain-containing protein [Thermogemmatispora sp.]